MTKTITHRQSDKQTQLTFILDMTQTGYTHIQTEHTHTDRTHTIIDGHW